MTRNRVIPLLVLLANLTFLSTAGTGLACTLYGAIGPAVEGGGVLLGKNRDLAQEEEQVLVRETPRTGLAFLGIASRKSGRITAGINDKGLVVVNSSASSVEDRTRNHIRLEKIFSQAGSVEGALRLLRQEGMKSPIHYLLADPRHLALLEVFSPERHEIKVTSDGILIHTNHYLLPSMGPFNGNPGESSPLRLERIRKLTNSPPLSPDRFMDFSRDHENGPGGNSICRHHLPGKKSGRVTVSALVVRLDPNRSPEIWVRLGHPCKGNFEKISF
jgi:isopenicillin-N N-acyltransferase like protein